MYVTLVNFDHPDGSTSCYYINYDVLVKFDSPDGSTYWGLKFYNILVNFDHPDGSTSWVTYIITFSLNLTLQMAAPIGVLNFMIC